MSQLVDRMSGVKLVRLLDRNVGKCNSPLSLKGLDGKVG